MLFTSDRLPCQEAVIVQPVDEGLDCLLKIPHFIQGTALEKVVSGDVGVEFTAHRVTRALAMGQKRAVGRASARGLDRGNG